MFQKYSEYGNGAVTKVRREKNCRFLAAETAERGSRDRRLSVSWLSLFPMEHCRNFDDRQ